MAWPVRAAEYAYVKVGNPDQTGGFGYALNNSGRVATTSLVRSFLFGDNSYSSYVEITNVNVAATTPGMVAQGMNDLGEVVGRFRTNGAPANQTRGFIRRNNGTFEVYDAPGVASTSISDNNGFGHFVGETRSDLTAFGQVRGFVNSNGFFSEIHFPSATLTRAYGINNGGDIVGQYQMEDGVNHAFLLSNGSYTEIVPTSAPGGLVSALATSISDNGKIVGTYRDSANATKTWVRLADGTFRYPTLPGSGWAINDAGQISGSFLDATNANARTPFVAAPPINFGALTNAAGLYSLGHGDVRAYYEGGQLKLRYQLDYNAVVNGGAVGGPLTGPVSFPLNEIIVAVPDITLPMPDPADLPAYAFIGAAAGDPLYYVPEVQEDDRPWLGFSSEELSLGQWEGDALQLNLVSVFGPAGAHLSMFSTDGVGEPLVHFATSNGIDAGDRYAYLSGGGSTPGLRVSTHAHVTWMFTKPGHYAVTLKYSGVHVIDGYKELTRTIRFAVAERSQASPAGFLVHRVGLANSVSDSATKINQKGEIIGTVDGQDGVTRGYIFSSKTAQEIERGGYAGSDFTEWSSINSSGVLAGYYADPADPTFNTFRAFVRGASGDFTPIQSPADPDFGFTVDINEHGQVAGGGSTNAWVWNTNGTIAAFSVPGFNVQGAFGMNDHGIVVGTAWPGFFDTPNGLIYDTTDKTFTIWNYPGAAQTTLYGINNRGDIVGEFKPNLTSANVPFVRWADGTAQVLRFPGLNSVRVYDIGDDRSVVGRYKDAANKNRSFYAAPIPPLPDSLSFTFEIFDVPGAADTLLSDIRNDGVMVGRYRDGNGLSQGFIQRGASRTDFNVTGTTATFPGGVDSFGRVAGFYRDASDPEVQHGFIRDTNGTITTIDGPGQNFTYAWRINDAGQVNGYWFEDPFFITSFRRAPNGSLVTNVFAGSPIGSVTRGMNEAGTAAGWKWTDAFAIEGVIFGADNTTNVFTVPGWDNTLPADINNLGEIAGTINNGFSVFKGFFRAANGATVTFVPPGAVAVEVFGMNDLRQIVGEFTDAAGRRHGFIASPAIGLDRGHTDVGIAFEDGRFHLHIHADETDIEYAPDKAALVLGPQSEQPIPDALAFSFLGEPGRSTWILPQVQNTNLLFLGFGAEEIESGVFLNNQLRITLESVTGPGEFALYLLDGFGSPVVRFNTADGISPEQDFYILHAGRHEDINWAFSAPGTYRVGVRVEGVLVDGNRLITSEIAYYTFEVPEARLPQPAQPESDTFTYTPLNVEGASYTYAFGINNSGRIVGRYGQGEIGRGYIRGKDGVAEAIDFPGASFTEVFGINDDSVLAGWYRSESATNGFVRQINGSFESIAPPGSAAAYALGVNTNGVIVGAFENETGQHGFMRDSDGAFTVFDPPGSTYTEPYGVDGSGNIVGYFADAAGERGFFRGANGAFTVYDVPGSVGSGILGINGWGDWTGYFEDETGVHGFLRKADGKLTQIDMPDGMSTVAIGVSDGGHIVGYYSDHGEIVRGFKATPAKRLSKGHTDIGALLRDGKFEMEVHSESLGEEFAPEAALLQLPALTQTTVPTNSSFAFLGVANAPIWILPQVQNPKLLFLGLAAEEIGSGLLVNNSIKFTLKAIEGPGHIALYSVDGFRNPAVHWNSRDGVSASDVKEIQAGSHEDFNWAFTAPGYYRVTIEANATLVAGNQPVSSGEVTYHFEVTGIETSLAIARNAQGTMALEFTTQDGIVYQLQSAGTLGAAWLNVGQPFIGTGREKKINVPIEGGSAFYRITRVD